MNSDDILRHHERREALNTAAKLTTGGTVAGRVLGALVSLLPWWLSGAPWWAIPLFVIVIGWLCGVLYGHYVARVLWRQLEAKYPELKDK